MDYGVGRPCMYTAYVQRQETKRKGLARDDGDSRADGLGVPLHREDGRVALAPGLDVVDLLPGHAHLAGDCRHGELPPMPESDELTKYRHLGRSQGPLGRCLRRS